MLCDRSDKKLAQLKIRDKILQIENLSTQTPEEAQTQDLLWRVPGEHTLQVWRRLVIYSRNWQNQTESSHCFFLAYLESVRAKPIRDCVAPSLLCFYVGSGFVVVYLKRNSAKTRFKNLS